MAQMAADEKSGKKFFEKIVTAFSSANICAICVYLRPPFNYGVARLTISRNPRGTQHWHL
jgi:hypothetical protein